VSKNVVLQQTNKAYYNIGILEQNVFQFNKTEIMKLEIGAYGKLLANLLKLKMEKENI
jgi:hypothetical protein